jgi:hypothetical protein
VIGEKYLGDPAIGKAPDAGRVSKPTAHKIERFGKVTICEDLARHVPAFSTEPISPAGLAFSDANARACFSCDKAS